MQTFDERQYASETCVLLYKIAKKNSLILPDPLVHTYLAGLLVTAEHPDMNLVVSKPSDIVDIARAQDRKGFSQAITYFVSRETGAHQLSPAATTTASFDDARKCLYYASIFAREINKDLESKLLGEIATNAGRYRNLIRAYFRVVHDGDGPKTEPQDFEDFKAFYQRYTNRPSRTLSLLDHANFSKVN